MPKKKIAITGTSKGLGLSLTHRFHEMGHQVFSGARTPLADLSTPPLGDYQTLDVTDSTSQTLWWDRAEQTLEGLPDIVLANAALINENNSLWNVSEDEFRKVMDANVVGVFLTLKNFIQRWEERGEGKPAVLIALSSGWGRSTSPDVATYCTSKWAVEGMMKALSQELPPQLSAVALNPGIINTEMLQRCFGSQAAHYDGPEEWSTRASRQILEFGRLENGASETIR